MSDIHIPPEALGAAAKRIYETWRDRDGTQLLPPWEWLAAEYRQTWLDQATAAIRAALAAWPGARNWQHCAPCNEGPHILLPTTEPRDD